MRVNVQARRDYLLCVCCAIFPTFFFIGNPITSVVVSLSTTLKGLSLRKVKLVNESGSLNLNHFSLKIIIGIATQL